MKLININVGIKIDNSKKIGDFLKSYNADIIALQEVVRHLDDSVFDEYQSKSKIENILENTYPYTFFGPLWVSDAFRKNGQIHRDFGGLIEQGNEILSKYLIEDAENLHYYKTYTYARDWTNWQTEDHGRALVRTELSINGQILQVLNLHGIWTSDKKGDQRTVKECEFVVATALKKDLPTIITGDFNLFPETESIQIINKNFTNLIDKFGIKTTRPDFKDNIDVGNNVVDYIFVNSKIKVNDFGVIHTDISDHLPLYLDFDIKS